MFEKGYLNVENKLMVTKGGRGGGISWEIGTDIYTVLYTKQIIHKNLLYSTGALLSTL